MLNWVFALFCADSLIHVISCAAGKQRLRHITKVLLMPLLAVAYITLCRRLSPIVIAGLALGWIGDIMLLRPGVKRFQMLGIGAFLLGHICYIAAMCVEFELSARFLPWACTAVLFAGISAVIYAVLWNKVAPDMRAAGIGYFVMKISDYIYVIDFGSEIAQGVPAEIQNNQRVIDAYLGVDEEDA